MVTPQVSAINMDLTDALRKYCIEKLMKFDYLLEKATTIKVELFQVKAHKGVSEDFKVSIEVDVPLSRIYAEEKGGDIYALIDELTDTIARNLKRYKEKFKHFDGQKSWAVADSQDEEVHTTANLDDYADYIPTISKRIKVKESRPMHEAEAIEHMELANRNSYLFKNLDGKWCMVFQDAGTYKMVEGE